MADILVVDDDDEVRTTLVEALAAEGYPARAAMSSPEALALATQRRPALILLDYFMPEMDGARFCAALGEGIGRDDTKIVVLTAANPAEVARIRAACNPDAGLTKPFDLDQLCATVRRLLPS